MAVTVLTLGCRDWIAAGRSLRVTAPKHPRLHAYCVFSGLAAQLGFGEPPQAGHPDSVTTPVRLFSNRDNAAILEVGKLVTRFVDMTSETEEVLRVLIAELVQNVADHAGSPGAISARLYREKRDVRVCVADHGFGLQTTLRRQYGDEEVPDDVSAVLLALQQGRSSRSQAHNAGQGINLMDDLLRTNGGEMLLASGTACYLRKGAAKRSKLLNHRFPGTICVMRFRIDNHLYGPGDRLNDDIW